MRLDGLAGLAGPVGFLGFVGFVGGASGQRCRLPDIGWLGHPVRSMRWSCRAGRPPRGVVEQIAERSLHGLRRRCVRCLAGEDRRPIKTFYCGDGFDISGNVVAGVTRRWLITRIGSRWSEGRSAGVRAVWCWGVRGIEVGSLEVGSGRIWPLAARAGAAKARVIRPGAIAGRVAGVCVCALGELVQSPGVIARTVVALNVVALNVVARIVRTVGVGVLGVFERRATGAHQRRGGHGRGAMRIALIRPHAGQGELVGFRRGFPTIGIYRSRNGEDIPQRMVGLSVVLASVAALWQSIQHAEFGEASELFVDARRTRIERVLDFTHIKRLTSATMYPIAELQAE